MYSYRIAMGVIMIRVCDGFERLYETHFDACARDQISCSINLYNNRPNSSPQKIKHTYPTKLMLLAFIPVQKVDITGAYKPTLRLWFACLVYPVVQTSFPVQTPERFVSKALLWGGKGPEGPGRPGGRLASNRVYQQPLSLLHSRLPYTVIVKGFCQFVQKRHWVLVQFSEAFRWQWSRDQCWECWEGVGRLCCSCLPSRL